MKIMNRKFRRCLLIVVLILAVCAFIFGLFRWQRNKVTQLVLEQKGIALLWDDDRYPARYLGTYDGGIVVMQQAENMSIITPVCGITVGGIEFESINAIEIFVVKDGTVHYLETAWREGWLTHEQLEQMQSRYNKLVGIA